MAAFLPRGAGDLLLRALTPADAPAFAAYRSDPAVARYQSWEAPYSIEAAEGFIAGLAGLDGPVAGQWVQIAIDVDGRLAGDVAVGLETNGLVASIGYTVAPSHQGRGLGRRAVAAVVDALFDELQVHRAQADLDPRNIPSARLVEALGFTHEGVLASSVLARGEWTDDARYGLTAAAHAAWRTRPRHPPADVRLVPITAVTSRTVLALETHWTQRRFVSPVSESYADALFPPLVDDVPLQPWLRAIEADGELVGFLMIAEATAAHPVPYLWRLLVERRHQRRHIGERAVERLIEHLRASGHRALLVSWHPGAGGPEPFYLRRGFVPTGVVEDGEVEARLEL